jgi:hypothetical protein
MAVQTSNDLPNGFDQRAYLNGTDGSGYQKSQNEVIRKDPGRSLAWQERRKCCEGVRRYYCDMVVSRTQSPQDAHCLSRERQLGES